MAVKIKSAEQMLLIIERLAGEIQQAHIQYKLHCDLGLSVCQEDKIYYAAPCFWHNTMHGLFHTAMMSLCRVYDKQKDSVCLNNWLKLIKENIHFFNEDNFRERHKDNPFIDSLSKVARIPDTNRLNEDIAKTSPSDPLVKKLVKQRNIFYGHIGGKYTINKEDIVENFDITYGEVNDLLERAHKILNRYSSLFDAHQYSMTMIGHDDFKNVLDAIHLTIKQRNDRIENEYQALTPKDK